jgi:hypothetical protein
VLPSQWPAQPLWTPDAFPVRTLIPFGEPRTEKAALTGRFFRRERRFVPKSETGLKAVALTPGCEQQIGQMHA